MVSNPVVVFDSATLARCHALADRIHANKFKEGATDLKFSGKLSSRDLHRIGMLGEYAAAKILGIKLNQEIHDGSDGGSDLEFHGVSIQVKTFTYTGPNREVFVTEPPNSTLIVSCRLLEPNKVEVEGWITTEDFMSQAKRKDYGYGERLSIPVSSLKDVRALLRMAQT